MTSKGIKNDTAQDGLHYTSTHEWIRIEPNNIAYIGITDHAQNLLGDMVLVDLPEIGAFIDSGDECSGGIRKSRI